MSSIVISGNTSGSVTLSAPDVAGSTTQTLVNASGTLAPLVSGTAVASTSGTSIDFTSIPSWVKRVTVMFSGVSTSGTSFVLIQLGAGSVTTSGYTSSSVAISTGGGFGGGNSTAGFILGANAAAAVRDGIVQICSVGSNLWVQSHAMSYSTTQGIHGGGNVTLSGTLDRVRITTVNGTDTFDAGTINVMYE